MKNIFEEGNRVFACWIKSDVPKLFEGIISVIEYCDNEQVGFGLTLLEKNHEIDYGSYLYVESENVFSNKTEAKKYLKKVVSDRLKYYRSIAKELHKLVSSL